MFGGWFKRNWKTLVTAAVSTVVFAAVVAAAPLIVASAPVLAVLAVAGVASGVAGYVTRQLLDHQPITAKGVVVSGVVGGVATVATAGVLSFAAPVVSRVAAPFVPEALAAVPQAVRVTATNTAVGATFGAGTKVASNAIGGRPLSEGLADATTVGAVNGALMAPLSRVAQQSVAASLASRRSALMAIGQQKYEDSLGLEDPNLRAAAQENYNHVKRLLASVDENEAAIRASGHDPDRVRLQLLYSDTFKDPASVDASARRLLPDLYAQNPGLAKLKAFLLHEEPAIEHFRENARAVGLPESEIESVVAGIRGHNGPASPGSWWGNMWKAQIENEAPRPGSELLGRPYPLPTRESALPTFLDRYDSRLIWDPAKGAYTGGPVKFVAEGVNRGESLQKAWDSATEVAYDGTARQLADIKALHPDIFEIPFVAKGENDLALTIAVRDRVRFLDAAGTTAEVQTPSGPVTVSSPADLWSALAAGHVDVAPTAPSLTKGLDGALGALSAQ